MKELDGLALPRQAHAMRPHVPVIVVSGHAERAVITDAMAMGPLTFCKNRLTVVNSSVCCNMPSRRIACHGTSKSNSSICIA